MEPGCAASQLHSGHAHCFEDWLARSVPIVATISCLRHFFFWWSTSFQIIAFLDHLLNMSRSGTCPVCREMLADDEEEEGEVGAEEEEEVEGVGGTAGGEGGDEEAG